MARGLCYGSVGAGAAAPLEYEDHVGMPLTSDLGRRLAPRFRAGLHPAGSTARLNPNTRR